MDFMVKVRDIASPVLDVDFFLIENNITGQFDNQYIAQMIRGTAYARVEKRVNEFIDRSKQTLDRVKSTVDQLEAEYESLVDQANANRPGKGPSKIFLDNSDVNSVNKYNDKVQRHNNQCEFHQRLLDKSERAREKFNDAIDKFKDKQADLDEQVREKKEELVPALDQDIVKLIGDIQKLTDNCSQTQDKFTSFLVYLLAKKAFEFLDDKIDNSNDRRISSEIRTQVNNKFNELLSTDNADIKTGLKTVTNYLVDCYNENATILTEIENSLTKLPYQECKDHESKIKSLLDKKLNTSFDYEDIIDPAELAKIDNDVNSNKTDAEKQIKDIDELVAQIEPIFKSITEVKSFVDENIQQMVGNKFTKYDPIYGDLVFILSIFDASIQDKYLSKQEQWLQEVQNEIKGEINISPEELINNSFNTELLTLSAKGLIEKDAAIPFLSYRENLPEKKQTLLKNIKDLDSILAKTNEIPKEKSTELSKSISSSIMISILPLVNIIIMFSVYGKINEFLPALLSSNTFYIDAREAIIKKMNTFSYVHIVLMIAGGAASFFVEPQLKPVMYAVGATYLISALMIFIKTSKLNKLKSE